MLFKMVGAGGFEPPTSSAQGWRATRLRYTPKELQMSNDELRMPGTRAGRTNFVQQTGGSVAEEGRTHKRDAHRPGTPKIARGGAEGAERAW